MRALPPIWLLGFCNMPLGLGGAVVLVTVPQLLAAKGVPETAIAWVTATGLVAGFTNFLLAPILDWRLTRQTYSILTAALAGLLSVAVLSWTGNLYVLALLCLMLLFSVGLNTGATGGWLSVITSSEAKGPLGAWMALANIGAFGGGAALNILAIRHLPPFIGPLAIGLLELLPIAVYLRIPATRPDPKLAQESFRMFVRDLLTLLRQPIVRWLVFFLAMPAATFALSNTLAGLGKDFGASEAMVGAVSGIGVAIAGMAGSILMAPLLRRFPPEWLYLLIGAGGAVFTIVQIWFPLNAVSFAIGMISQNALQAAVVATINVMMLRASGEDNPLAATQFALLNAATCLPLSYMQAIDGAAYGEGGLAASYLADALISLVSCAVLTLLLWRRQPRQALLVAG